MNKILFSAFLVAVFAAFSLAQSSDDYKKGEIFVGYSPNVIDASSGDATIFHGVNVSGVYNFSKNIGIKADFSTHHKSAGASTPNGIALKASLQNFLGGVQFKNNSHEGRVKPFVHALVGVARLNASANFFGTSARDSDTGLAIAIGGGIDIRVNKRVSIRIAQIDYNPIRLNGGTINNVRLGFGIVF